jgi:acyl-CoA synthetase (AMP-forming)/AMP-acid ligase II
MPFATVHHRYSPDEIARYYAQGLWTGLAIQEVPEGLGIVESLPTTATGTIQKHLLRADTTAKLEADLTAAATAATAEVNV